MFKKDLSITSLGVKFENPFLLASSPVASSYDMCAKAFDAGWAGVVFKTVGIFIADEVSPRFASIGKESTPFIGFKNLEQISEKSLEENLEVMRKLKQNYPTKIIIASIMGENNEEWETLAKLVTDVGADIIECNFSCPQMTSSSMGADVGQNPELVKEYCMAVRRGSHLPILAKMTPNLGNMVIPAAASLEGGADGFAAINTIKSIIGIDFNDFASSPSVFGKSAVSGYSGKAIKPIALRFIHELKSNALTKHAPISGIGGIETWEDALEFILMGSETLQICTAVMQYGYRIIDDMINGLSHYMEEKNIDKVEDLVGKAVDNIIPAEDLERGYIVYPNFNTHTCINCGRCYISCYDGGHQALTWEKNTRLPKLDKTKCIGCHLCSLVCPANSITSGEKVSKLAR